MLEPNIGNWKCSCLVVSWILLGKWTQYRELKGNSSSSLLVCPSSEPNIGNWKRNDQYLRLQQVDAEPNIGNWKSLLVISITKIVFKEPNIGNWKFLVALILLFAIVLGTQYRELKETHLRNVNLTLRHFEPNIGNWKWFQRYVHDQYMQRTQYRELKVTCSSWDKGKLEAMNPI